MRVRGWYLPACSAVQRQHGGLAGGRRAVVHLGPEQGLQAEAEALGFFACHAGIVAGKGSAAGLLPARAAVRVDDVALDEEAKAVAPAVHRGRRAVQVIGQRLVAHVPAAGLRLQVVGRPQAARKTFFGRGVAQQALHRRGAQPACVGRFRSRPATPRRARSAGPPAAAAPPGAHRARWRWPGRSAAGPAAGPASASDNTPAAGPSAHQASAAKPRHSPMRKMNVSASFTPDPATTCGPRASRPGRSRRSNDLWHRRR